MHRHCFHLHDGGDRLRQVQRHRQGLQRYQDQHGQGRRDFGKGSSINDVTIIPYFFKWQIKLTYYRNYKLTSQLRIYFSFSWPSGHMPSVFLCLDSSVNKI